MNGAESVPRLDHFAVDVRDGGDDREGGEEDQSQLPRDLEWQGVRAGLSLLAFAFLLWPESDVFLRLSLSLSLLWCQYASDPVLIPDTHPLSLSLSLSRVRTSIIKIIPTTILISPP